MKKQLKALLIAGIAASLAVMPVYGAGSASLGAVRYAYEPTDDDIAAGPGAVQQAAQEAAIAEAAQAEAEAAQAKEEAQSAFRAAIQSAMAGAVSTTSATANRKGGGNRPPFWPRHRLTFSWGLSANWIPQSL